MSYALYLGELQRKLGPHLLVHIAMSALHLYIATPIHEAK